ncbi:MAG: tautomerase family protein, partial [Fimbriimonadaceae bacterium]|nr:tautomerase family protein [Alphaproteobacteria bacterium]
MPVVTCTLIEGYSAETRKVLEECLTDAVHAATGAPWDVITVILNEVPGTNYMRGRTHRTPAAAPSAPSEVVREFLQTMERRDLAGAAAFLSENFKMTFPGGAAFTKLTELVEWAKDRYTSVGKTYERFDEAYGPDGATVYCYGT